jgi:hypothetical protein
MVVAVVRCYHPHRRRVHRRHHHHLRRVRRVRCRLHRRHFHYHLPHHLHHHHLRDRRCCFSYKEDVCNCSTICINCVDILVHCHQVQRLAFHSYHC